MSNKFTEQLNNLRLLAGVPIKAEHGKRKEQPEQHLDEARRPNPKMDTVVKGIKEVIQALNREQEQASNDDDLDELYASDKKDWQRVLQAVNKGDHQAAQRAFRRLDSTARDYVNAIQSQATKKALEQYFSGNVELTEGKEVIKVKQASGDQEIHDRIKKLKDAGIEAASGGGNNKTDIVVDKQDAEQARKILGEAEQKSANRQDTTDQGDQTGMQDWKSYTVTLRTPDQGTRTEVVSARSKSEARRRARQQAPDGSHVSGTPDKMDENVVNEARVEQTSKLPTFTLRVRVDRDENLDRIRRSVMKEFNIDDFGHTGLIVKVPGNSEKEAVKTLQSYLQDQGLNESYTRISEEGAGGQSSYQITYNDGNEKKSTTVQAGNKAAARRKGPQGKRVVDVQELDTTNEAEDKKTFTVWGEVDIKQDTKNKKRDIKASSEEEAEKIMLNNLKQWARTNKQGSAKSARVTRVEQKSRTDEAHYYGTDYYPSHEEDDDASINVVDYDQEGEDVDASTNSPDSTKTEVPQQTYNRGEESSENQEEEVKVPNDVKKELKDTIETFRQEAERLEQRGGSTAQHNRQFYNDTADAFEDLLGYLELGTIEGIKGAQMYASKLMGPMLHKLPTNTWKFIQRGGINRSLKSYMGQVHDDYPITGPRNTIDDNDWGK